MAKKRRKKSGKGPGIGTALAAGVKLSAQFVVKAFPFFLLLVAAAALGFGIRSALYADSYLSIQKIAVKPPEALAVKHLERLKERLLGKNILALDIQSVAEELERDPEIRTARVHKLLPFELEIEIEKRAPFAFLRLPGKGAYGIISEDGMILDTVPERNVSGLIVEASDLGVGNPSAGKKVEIRGLEDAVKFSGEFQNHILARYETLTKIDLDHLGNATITLGRGPAVRLGRRPTEKLAALEQVLPLIEGQGREKIDYIDLEFENVIIKHKRGVK